MAKSPQAIRDKWKEIRDNIQKEIDLRQNPCLWGRIALSVAENKEKLPILNEKWPMSYAIVEGFKKTPLHHFDLEYLWQMRSHIRLSYPARGSNTKYTNMSFRTLVSEADRRISRIETEIREGVRSSIPNTAPSRA